MKFKEIRTEFQKEFNSDLYDKMRKLHSDKFLQIHASAELRFILIERVTEKAKYVGFFMIILCLIFRIVLIRKQYF